ncbi:MAG: CDP-glycerol glycerophosphotransferase family protein [Candidatus Electryonea clarkiae]|nr:CDP-glycerol glycerophosphotransferase family protein [Candidatus Electryonea clarkiae]MDP8287671.1 CDP-glycerol glycerophosphotransferase family protein [Candidatus Electryonea clarkiae]
MRRALFYFHTLLDTSSLLPVFRELQKTGEFEIAFVIHPYDSEQNLGLPPGEAKLLHQQGVDVIQDPQKWEPDITFISDLKATFLTGSGKTIYITRSLSSKGRFSPVSSKLHKYNTFDMVCVPGNFYKNRLANSGKVYTKVISTGFTPLDSIFSPGYLSREEIIHQAGLDPHKKIVLYAPTHDMEYSAASILWTRIGVLANDNTILFIKLHPNTPSIIKRAITHAFQHHPNIKTIDNFDLHPYLRVADVIVSDVSSAWLEFLALDKPVVLFDNPNKVMHEGYDERDAEFVCRDALIVATNLEEVIDGVRRSLAFPGEFSGKRQKYISGFIHETDGQSARRIIDAALTLDVAAPYPVTTENNLDTSKKQLTTRQREYAEKRVRELSDSIGGILRSVTPKTNQSNQILQINTGSASYHPENGNLRLAMHYEKRGKLDEAKKQVGIALRNNPDNPVAVEFAAHLGMLAAEKEPV